jgi:hypothetical protein
MLEFATGTSLLLTALESGALAVLFLPLLRGL